MSVLITGVAGFIGGHTADFFISNNEDVVGCDSLTYAANQDTVNDLRSKIQFYDLDICNTEKIIKATKSQKIDTIINFAAETHVDNSIKDVSPFIHSNIHGVVSLLEVARNTGARLIHISTDEVYGPAGDDVSFKEEDVLSPKNPYAATKASADLLIQSFKNTYNVKASIVRPCNNFGPRQNKEKFIPTILNSLSKKRKIPIYGDGSQRREWIFVKDTARIIYEIFNKKVDFDVLNITSGFELKNIEVTKKIAQKEGLEFDEIIEFVEDRPGHDLRYSISIEKLRKYLDCKFTDFDVALDETIAFYKAKHGRN